MASISDIRFHINSVKQTRQITNAMYLVSTARMRKALRGIEQNRAYFYHALDTMKDIRARINIQHDYLTHREGTDKTAYIVVAGEKGLSGSYNNDVLNMAEESIKSHDTTHLFVVGNIAAAHFRNRHMNVDDSFTHIGEAPRVNTARRIVSEIVKLYDAKEIDELRIVYTHFINALTHKPRDVKLLPIELDSFEEDRDAVYDRSELMYFPSSEVVFHSLVPQFIIGYVYGALVHAYASENFARMGAMESATRSADEMLAKLTQQYHSLRQLSVTEEITEIVSAANAVTG